MLPVPTPTEVPIEMAGRKFTFRRLSWRDEVEFQKMRSTNPAFHILAFALSHVDGRTVRSEDALRLVTALPRPIRERMTKLYLGSLPRHRVVEVAKAPEPAPVPAEVQSRAIEEVEAAEQAADDELARRFGDEEAEYAREQELQIAQASGMRGAARSIESPDLPHPHAPVSDPEDDGDIEDTISLIPATKYHAVM